jgi:hypothetical protein
MSLYVLGEKTLSEANMVVLKQANEDFDAIIAGKQPVFAKVD